MNTFDNKIVCAQIPGGSENCLEYVNDTSSELVCSKCKIGYYLLDKKCKEIPSD